MNEVRTENSGEEKKSAENPREIRAILVDLGGVVVTNGFWDWIDKLGVSKEERDVFREAIDAADIGEISEKECMDRLSSLSRKPPKKVREELTESFTPLPGMTDLLESLKDRYHLILVTNFMTSFANTLLDKYNLRGYFERIFISAVVKKAKPSIEFFHHVTKEVGLNPENCLFVDDSQRNIETATSMGMPAILFSNKEQLEEELRQRSILV